MKRLKELALAALKNPHNPLSEASNVGDIHCFDDEELKKFAELIVLECGQIGDNWVNFEDDGLTSLVPVLKNISILNDNSNNDTIKSKGRGLNVSDDLLSW